MWGVHLRWEKSRHALTSFTAGTLMLPGAYIPVASDCLWAGPGFMRKKVGSGRENASAAASQGRGEVGSEAVFFARWATVVAWQHSTVGCACGRGALIAMCGVHHHPPMRRRACVLVHFQGSPPPSPPPLRYPSLLRNSWPKIEVDGSLTCRDVAGNLRQLHCPCSLLPPLQRLHRCIEHFSSSRFSAWIRRRCFQM
jgi:hypothetical protein